ncbi:hypothetical protein M3661_17925 [Paenibacillus sp. MER 180]|uniref:hypothetical protein n=1 Tax=Paenibacillus sp. MER 180 TaxID=2939570 RepID=UPI00203E317E|nr:hypothetical protein [Paenibacillus sp. MER 180]MCM3292004.1 hypothetical protein [Paenibacillus sp. MER 180]
MRAMVIDKYRKIDMRMAEVPMPEINEYEVDSDHAKKPPQVLYLRRFLVRVHTIAIITGASSLSAI